MFALASFRVASGNKHACACVENDQAGPGTFAPAPLVDFETQKTKFPPLQNDVTFLLNELTLPSSV